MNNSIMTIRPFKKGSVWVFSEPRMNIFEEPFVGDINDMIDAMLQRADLPASEPFTAMFSSSPFPGYHMQLAWDEEESGGNWYLDVSTVRADTVQRIEELTRGWLCPVLCLFFASPPKNIFVRAEK